MTEPMRIEWVSGISLWLNTRSRGAARRSRRAIGTRIRSGTSRQAGSPRSSWRLAEAAALRDAAQRLTPAAVALDEQARLHWTPLRAGLDAAAADPHTPGPVREELEAAREALARVGL